MQSISGPGGGGRRSFWGFQWGGGVSRPVRGEGFRHRLGGVGGGARGSPKSILKSKKHVVDVGEYHCYF